MFDRDRFIADCQSALGDKDPAATIAALLTDALCEPQALADAFAEGADQPGVMPLFRSDELTVAHVISAPGSRSPVHNHRMWGVIGIYAGQEDNHLYRRGEDGLVDDGLKSLRAGDVFVMDPELIHAVANPRADLNGGLHVYGGDLMARPNRSLWDPDSGAEQPYAFERVLEYTQRLSGR
jgi:predicted metal-dependent enzyme (double-stranded beta helix superfamily)